MHVFLTKSSRYRNKNFVTEKGPTHSLEYIQFSMTADHDSFRKYILVEKYWITEIKTLHTDESVLFFIKGI